MNKLFKKIFHEKNNSTNIEKAFKPQYDVAVSCANDKAIFEYIDTFAHENRVYSFMKLIGTTDVLIFEELELRGRKLGKGLEDTCYVPIQDPIVQAMAVERNTKGESAHFHGDSIMLTGMRTLDDYENELGCKISVDKLFYHDKIEL